MSGMKKFLSITALVLAALFILSQSALCLMVSFSDADRGSYLYGKWYFAAKPFVIDRGRLIKRGDTVTLGTYQYSADGSAAPIKWTVISVGKESVQLLSTDIIDVGAYNAGQTETVWSRSLMRDWLNNGFFDAAFSDDEKKSIQLRTTVTDYRNNTNSDLGIDYSDDYVTIPYVTDIKTIDPFHVGNRFMRGKLTPYALKRFNEAVSADKDVHRTGGTDPEKWAEVVWVDGKGNGTWWLRSPGYQTAAAAHVDTSGNAYNTDYFGMSYTLLQTDDPSIGIRPMIYVDISYLIND